MRKNFLSALLVPPLVARRNLRRGVGGRRGAWRLGLTVTALSLASWSLRTDAHGRWSASLRSSPGAWSGSSRTRWARLYGLLDSLYERVKGVWEERFERSYGFRRGLVDEVVASHLACGLWPRRLRRGSLPEVSRGVPGRARSAVAGKPIVR